MQYNTARYSAVPRLAPLAGFNECLFNTLDACTHYCNTGGEFHSKMVINMTNPTIPQANGMGNWHQLGPRVRFGTFTFYIGKDARNRYATATAGPHLDQAADSAVLLAT